MTPALAIAVELLAGWSGPAGSWFFERDGEILGSEREPEYANGQTHLSIAKRGRVIEQAGTQTTPTRTRRFHNWKRYAGVAYVPAMRPRTDAAMALAWMGGRSGVHADLLLVYAQEDWGRWPRVRFLLSATTGISSPILDHALAALMRPMKRTAISAGELAMAVRMRKVAYLDERRRANALLQRTLDTAALRFMSAFGNRSFPQNDTLCRGPENQLAA